MTVFRRMFTESPPQDPEVWHEWRAWYPVCATLYDRSPSGQSEFVVGYVMRRSIDHMDIGHIRIHRWAYRVGSPAAQGA